MKLNLKAKKILVVEDYPVMRKAIEQMLYTLNAQNIMTAESGLAAISEMKKDKFDIVLCDYNLGTGKNGQQVLEEAHYYKLLPFNAIFIMITAEQNQGMVLGAMDSKPDEYLTKPFNAQQLFSRLQRNFARKHYLASIEREIAKGNLSLATHNCEKLLRQNDPNMRLSLLKLRGELALMTDDLSTAQDVYQQVLQQRDLPWARLGLGMIAFQQNNYELAISTLQDLIGLNPMMLEAYDWLAKAHEAAGAPLAAMDTVNLAVDLSPSAILRQKKLATLADKINNLEIAEKAYKAAVKLGTYSVHKSSSDYAGLANVYVKTNAPIQALQTLDELHQQFINDPDAELRAAIIETQVYKQLGDDALAQQAFEKALSLNDQFVKNTPAALGLELAKTCFQQDKLEASEKIIDALVQRNIEDNAFIDAIQQMCAEFNQNSYAENLIQRTRQEIAAINNHGVALFKQGKLTEAIGVFENANARMPDNKAIILNMTKILVFQIKASGGSEDQIMNAKRYIKKAIQLGVPFNKINLLQQELIKLASEHAGQQM
jgi:DNA-binding NarL/FixJ family response regulator/Tfp pilus assembly protein PilF